MFHATGFDVTYEIRAFTARGSFPGHVGYPTSEQRKDAHSWATGAVIQKGNGNWMIVTKDLGRYTDEGYMTDLVFVIRSGEDQYQQLMAAIQVYEETMAARLGGPVNPNLRFIEGKDSLICELCGSRAEWLVEPVSGGTFHYCGLDAVKQPGFKADNDRYKWRKLELSQV